MQKFDVLIIGGGMVGLTLAIAIRKLTPLSVAIVDTLLPTDLADEPEVRVSAINSASQHLFANLDVWSLIDAQRTQPYQHMHVWDKAGYGQLNFDISELKNDIDSEQLGWIIENKVIRNALWQKAQLDDGITLFTEEVVTNVAMGDSEVFASFASHPPIMAKLLVGADGANSWVRQQMDMPLAFRDYDHHAVVATVQCQDHQNTAWQVFLPTGPLAFLPLYQQDLCSIVFSTSPQDAQRVVQLDAEAFAKELTAASDGKLGKIKLLSKRYTHPLTMRLAHDFIKQRVVLIGDAAHTIHPLAGQGVNLGLLDAAALAQVLAEQVSEQSEHSQSAWVNDKSLQAFSRWRRSEATDMIAAMEAIKQIFTPQNTASNIVRGIGLSLLDRFSPAKNQLMQQALGHKSNLPELAKQMR
ncbi:FAD-dependent monooxygenase [Colwelliaceae bacterium 6471]